MSMPLHALPNSGEKRLDFIRTERNITEISVYIFFWDSFSSWGLERSSFNIYFSRRLTSEQHHDMTQVSFVAADILKIYVSAAEKRDRERNKKKEKTSELRRRGWTGPTIDSIETVYFNLSSFLCICLSRPKHFFMSTLLRSSARNNNKGYTRFFRNGKFI